MTDKLKWETISSEYIYKETWFTARKDTCKRQDGKVVPNYYVFEFPEWVTAFALTEEGKIIFTRQYRHALGETCWELPGGCVDAEDKDYETAIRRELLEETGYEFAELTALGRISANPSTDSNLMHMFIATGGKKTSEQNLDANEEIEIIELSFDELFSLMNENKIMQSMHLSTIYYALRHLGKITLKSE